MMQGCLGLSALTVRSKPYHDSEEMLSMCYRCSTYNPLMTSTVNCCTNCGQPFVHSFVSFGTLLHFLPSENISSVTLLLESLLLRDVMLC